MKVAVWRTGHEIADTVADAVFTGLQNAEMCQVPPSKYLQAIGDINIGYGILREIDAIFCKSQQENKPWFNIDRGYINPHHYGGYYRVSLRGTQQTIGLDKLQPDYDRLTALGVEFKPWRGFDESKPMLIIPPTDYVKGFFEIDKNEREWLRDSPYGPNNRNALIRTKKDTSVINFDDYSYVHTFNSSVGWQAIAAGIPCISDPTHSFVGAYYKQLLGNDKNVAENYAKAQHDTRHELFGCMASLQLTLDEMRAGKIWELMTQLMSSSVGIAEKPSVPMSQPILSPSALVSL